jgi:hypothetical protein
MKYTTITVSIGGNRSPKAVTKSERREIARQKRYTARAIRRAAKAAISEALESIAA